MTSGEQHAHGPDLWRVLDILVWLSIGVIVVIGAESLIGYIIRERIASGARRHLVKVSQDAAGESAAE